MSEEEKTKAPETATQPAPSHGHNKIQVNDIGAKGRASLKSRILVAVVLIAMALPCIIFGGWYWFAFVLLFLLIAIHEVIKAPQKPFHWYIYLFTYILIISFTIWFLIKYNGQALKAAQDNQTAFTPSLEAYFSRLDVSLYGIAVALGFYFFVAIIHDDFSLNDVCYFFTLSILVGLGFQALMFLRFYPTYIKVTVNGQEATNLFRWWTSSLLLIFVVLGTILNDTFAYFVGMFFGKHHMNERISPKKTWEGFWGGWILSALFTTAFALIVDACGTPILPNLDLNHWYWVVVIALVIPLFGDLGDFSFSLIKRFFGFKDFGTILKAHGGILDRADSLIFACIAASIVVIFINGGLDFFA
jgi:phosphatidate cytidylyltransferase